ncbi:hypothetical protein [Pseudoclavibacter helvolus]|uniref:hypothetical protein n=1 Tax=Pseudoclavibacter helvolus TaxID=255205 RepID=UPI003C766639
MAKSDELREHVVSVRLSDAERNAWEHESSSDGYRQTARWTRELVNREIAQRSDGINQDRRPVESRLLKPLREHTKVLNRIARLLSALVESGQVLTEEDLRRIEVAVLHAGDDEPDR